MGEPRASSLPRLIDDPRARGLVWQALLVVAIGLAIWLVSSNAYVNMRARGIPTGFSFWNQTAGFDINQKLIAYSALSTYGRAFWVGLCNTALVAVLGVALATPLGFAIGVARLSPNWILSKAALVYVEILRNTPLLLQLLFWYNAVLKALPAPRQSLSVFGIVFLNNRGLYLPRPEWSEDAWWIVAALAFAALAILIWAARARRRQALTGEQTPVFWPAALALIAFPTLAYFLAGQPVRLDLAHQSGFNLAGGAQVLPEFAALVFGLVTYTAAFIAEIVRAGVMAVAKGQTEAASALGLRPGLTTRLVVIPQAMRLITPPLTSQYLNIVKNSSLAVFIGYPDLVQIFAGTVLNQTQAAVQIMAITMGVYLSISLVVAGALNILNARRALRER